MAATLACGPSVQFIYEGNIRFEHCYRLDLEEQVAPSHRRACWEEWVDHFSSGQTRDRIEYARRRIEALKEGDGAALSLRLADPSDAGPPAALSDPTPVPTSAHVPPPARIQAPAPSSSANSEVPGGNTAKPPSCTAEPASANDLAEPQGPASPDPKRKRAKKTKP